MILVASPTWISTIALRVSLSTILESLSSLPLRINNEYDDLVGGIDKFCTQTNILQFLLKWENHLIMLAACWFAWLPAGLGPRSTTCFKASITLCILFWFTWSMLIALNVYITKIYFKIEINRTNDNKCTFTCRALKSFSPIFWGTSGRLLWTRAAENQGRATLKTQTWRKIVIRRENAYLSYLCVTRFQQIDFCS